MSKMRSPKSAIITLFLLQTTLSMTACAAFTSPIQRSGTSNVKQHRAQGSIRRQQHCSIATTPTIESQRVPRRRQRGASRSYANALHMTPQDLSVETMLQHTPSIHLSSITATLSNPLMEVEILKDISHVLGDVVPLMEAPTLLFRLSALLGRILAMEAHYIPEHEWLDDDLLFNLPLLALSLVLSWRSMAPILRAALSEKPSPLDQIAFVQLFEPVGVNWIQYRSMLATCLDWVTLESGQVLECESEIMGSELHGSSTEKEYLYWLYEGDVTGYYEGNFLTNIERHDGKSINDPSAVGLLADMRFLYNLDLKQKRKTESDLEVVKYPMATFRVGKRGATLMRIEADRLYDLMEHDEHLEASIRQLLLKSLQRKVGLLLRSKSQADLAQKKFAEEEIGLPHELSM